MPEFMVPLLLLPIVAIVAIITSFTYLNAAMPLN